jgi:ectoine hydroxylase-related dioxygenase (phytanoyl-CoA dioxygenase family)
VTDAADPAIVQTSQFAAVFSRTPLTDLAARFLSGPDIWFYYEQLFYKHGGATRRTPWHQDTSYVPVEGPDIVRFWISFDPVDKDHALEFIRASHLGPLYNGSSFNPEDDTAPLFPHSAMPRLPDIEADRGRWDIISWSVEPGDIIAFHPSMLHGGAGTPPDRRRRSLSLVFFGDAAYFAPRPAGTVEANGPDDPRLLSDPYAGLKPGDRFRLSHLPKLR